MSSSPSPAHLESDHDLLLPMISRYFAAVDEHRLDAGVVEATFTAEARMVRPNGSAMTGHTEILAEQTRSFARFRATHHVTSDYLIEVDEKTATIRANLTAMHLWNDDDADPRGLGPHFVAGAVLTARARVAPVGWRLDVLELRAVWRAGSGFDAMVSTGAPMASTSPQPVSRGGRLSVSTVAACCHDVSR